MVCARGLSVLCAGSEVGGVEVGLEVPVLWLDWDEDIPVLDEVELGELKDEEDGGSRDLATALSIREVARESTDFLGPEGLFFRSPL